MEEENDDPLKADWWCSWCYQYTTHIMEERGIYLRSVYRCGSCLRRTLRCRTDGCNAGTRGGVLWDDLFCAVCDESLERWPQQISYGGQAQRPAPHVYPHAPAAGPAPPPHPGPPAGAPPPAPRPGPDDGEAAPEFPPDQRGAMPAAGPQAIRKDQRERAPCGAGLAAAAPNGAEGQLTLEVPEPGPPEHIADIAVPAPTVAGPAFVPPAPAPAPAEAPAAAPAAAPGEKKREKKARKAPRSIFADDGLDPYLADDKPKTKSGGRRSKSNASTSHPAADDSFNPFASSEAPEEAPPLSAQEQLVAEVRRSTQANADAKAKAALAQHAAAAAPPAPAPLKLPSAPHAAPEAGVQSSSPRGGKKERKKKAREERERSASKEIVQGSPRADAKMDSSQAALFGSEALQQQLQVSDVAQSLAAIGLSQAEQLAAEVVAPEAAVVVSSGLQAQLAAQAAAVRAGQGLAAKAAWGESSDIASSLPDSLDEPEGYNPFGAAVAAAGADDYNPFGSAAHDTLPAAPEVTVTVGEAEWLPGKSPRAGAGGGEWDDLDLNDDGAASGRKGSVGDSTKLFARLADEANPSPEFQKSWAKKSTSSSEGSYKSKTKFKNAPPPAKDVTSLP